MLKLHVVIVPPHANHNTTSLHHRGSSSLPPPQQLQVQHYQPQHSSSPYQQSLNTSTPPSQDTTVNGSFFNTYAGANSSVMGPPGLPIQQRPQPTNYRRFLHITKSDRSLYDIVEEIQLRFSKLYPEEEPLDIVKVQDSSECDLDLDYLASEVFDYDNVLRVVVLNNITADSSSRAPSRTSSNSIIGVKRVNDQSKETQVIPNKKKRAFIPIGTVNAEARSTPLVNRIYPSTHSNNSDDDEEEEGEPDSPVYNTTSNRNISLAIDTTTRVIDPKKPPSSPMPKNTGKRITSGMLVVPEPQLKDASDLTLQEMEIDEQLSRIVPTKRANVGDTSVIAPTAAAGEYRTSGLGKVTNLLDDVEDEESEEEEEEEEEESQADKTTIIQSPVKKKQAIVPVTPASKVVGAKKHVTISPPEKESAAAKATHSKAASAKSTPAKSTPAKSTPAKSTPAKSTPAKSTPAKSTPAKSTPAKSTPAKSTPAERTSDASTPKKVEATSTKTDAEKKKQEASVSAALKKAEDDLKKKDVEEKKKKEAEEKKAAAAEAKKAKEETAKKAKEEQEVKKRAELEKKKKEEEAKKATELKKAEEQRKKEELEKKNKEEAERKKAEAEIKKAEQLKKKADAEAKRLEAERKKKEKEEASKKKAETDAKKKKEQEEKEAEKKAEEEAEKKKVEEEAKAAKAAQESQQQLTPKAQAAEAKKTATPVKDTPGARAGLGRAAKQSVAKHTEDSDEDMEDSEEEEEEEEPLKKTPVGAKPIRPDVSIIADTTATQATPSSTTKNSNAHYQLLELPSDIPANELTEAYKVVEKLKNPTLTEAEKQTLLAEKRRQITNARKRIRRRGVKEDPANTSTSSASTPAKKVEPAAITAAKTNNTPAKITEASAAAGAAAGASAGASAAGASAAPAKTEPKKDLLAEAKLKLELKRKQLAESAAKITPPPPVRASSPVSSISTIASTTTTTPSTNGAPTSAFAAVNAKKRTAQEAQEAQSDSDSDSEDSDESEDSEDDEEEEQRSVKKPRIVNTPKGLGAAAKSVTDAAGALLKNALKGAANGNGADDTPSKKATDVDTKDAAKETSPSVAAAAVSDATAFTATTTTATEPATSTSTAAAKPTPAQVHKRSSSRYSLTSLSDLAFRALPDVKDSLTPSSSQSQLSTRSNGAAGGASQSKEPEDSDTDVSDDNDSDEEIDSDSDDSDSDDDSDGSDSEKQDSKKFINAKTAKGLLGSREGRSSRMSSAFGDLIRDSKKKY